MIFTLKSVLRKVNQLFIMEGTPESIAAMMLAYYSSSNSARPWIANLDFAEEDNIYIMEFLLVVYKSCFAIYESDQCNLSEQEFANALTKTFLHMKYRIVISLLDSNNRNAMIENLFVLNGDDMIPNPYHPCIMYEKMVKTIREKPDFNDCEIPTIFSDYHHSIDKLDQLFFLHKLGPNNILRINFQPIRLHYENTLSEIDVHVENESQSQSENENESEDSYYSTIDSSNSNSDESESSVESSSSGDSYNDYPVESSGESENDT